jgi:hypothetical protein
MSWATEFLHHGKSLPVRRQVVQDHLRVLLELSMLRLRCMYMYPTERTIHVPIVRQ